MKFTYLVQNTIVWLGSRVVSVLDPSAERPGFKLQPRRCRVTVLGKLYTPIVPPEISLERLKLGTSNFLE